MPADFTTPLINIALLRIGANPITAYNDGSPNALKAMIAYPYCLQRLLSAKDWKFAKLRSTGLVQNPLGPPYGYKYAYQLPSDFLRLCMSHFPQLRGLNPIAYPPGYWYQIIDTTGYPRYYNYDPSVYPPGAPWVMEKVPGNPSASPPVPDAFCILTDYDNTTQPLYIDYIQNVLQGSESRFTPGFTECFLFRLAQELAVPVCESQTKKQDMERCYLRELDSAEAINESLDSIYDETGSTAWEDAGR